MGSLYAIYKSYVWIGRMKKMKTLLNWIVGKADLKIDLDLVNGLSELSSLS